MPNSEETAKDVDRKLRAAIPPEVAEEHGGYPPLTSDSKAYLKWFDSLTLEQRMFWLQNHPN